MQIIAISEQGLSPVRLLVILNWGGQQGRFDVDRFTGDPTKR
jgi:hypothetical protein